MKTIICGSRGITSYKILCKVIDDSKFKITEVVSGTAQGVDQLGERWAREHNTPIKSFPPDWKNFGKSAGFKRNQEMVDYADQAIILHDGESKGAAHTYKLCLDKGIPHYYAVMKKQSLKFTKENIEALIASVKKTPYVSSNLFIEALEFIKQNVQLS